MTNDEIRKRAERTVENWRQDSHTSETTRLINYVHSAIFLAVTAALEEAAKACDLVADGACTMADEHLDSYTHYANQATGAEKCADAVRALIPSTGTKE